MSSLVNMEEHMSCAINDGHFKTSKNAFLCYLGESRIFNADERNTRSNQSFY